MHSIRIQSLTPVSSLEPLGPLVCIYIMIHSELRWLFIWLIRARGWVWAMVSSYCLSCIVCLSDDNSKVPVPVSIKSSEASIEWGNKSWSRWLHSVWPDPLIPTLNDLTCRFTFYFPRKRSHLLCIYTGKTFKVLFGRATIQTKSI